MKTLILGLCVFTSLGLFAQSKVIDFDGRSFAQERNKMELELDGTPSEIKSLARREFDVHIAVLNVKNNKNMLQIRASEDLFGESIFIDFKSKSRAKLAQELIQLGEVDILLDQVRAGAIPSEDKVFIHDKTSGKVVGLSPFLDELKKQRDREERELRRRKELEEGDYQGIGGFFRSVMDRIKGVGTYAENEDDPAVEDSDRSIAADKEDDKEKTSQVSSASAESN